MKADARPAISAAGQNVIKLHANVLNVKNQGIPGFLQK